MIEGKTTLARLLEKKGDTIYTIDRHDTVFACVDKMNHQQVGALLIIEAQRLVGIVSERDIIRKVVAQHRDGEVVHVDEIMSTVLTTVTPHTTVSEAMTIVTTSRIRHLPVIDEAERVVGLISIGDLVNWVMHEQQRHIEALTNYISGDGVV